MMDDDNCKCGQPLKDPDDAVCPGCRCEQQTCQAEDRLKAEKEERLLNG